MKEIDVSQNVNDSSCVEVEGEMVDITSVHVHGTGNIIVDVLDGEMHELQGEEVDYVNNFFLQIARPSFVSLCIKVLKQLGFTIIAPKIERKSR